MYDDIADLLGDARATGFAASDGRKKPEASLPIQGSSQTAALAQASTAAFFAIDPVLEAISLEMESTQVVDSDEAVR
jgi:hypothetical protein